MLLAQAPCIEELLTVAFQLRIVFSGSLPFSMHTKRWNHSSDMNWLCFDGGLAMYASHEPCTAPLKPTADCSGEEKDCPVGVSSIVSVSS
jgi:hypothetical protein